MPVRQDIVGRMWTTRSAATRNAVHLKGEGAAEAVRTSLSGFPWRLCAETSVDSQMKVRPRAGLWISRPETTRRAVDFTGEDDRMLRET